jgi:hypothetical protein
MSAPTELAKYFWAKVYKHAVPTGLVCAVAKYLSLKREVANLHAKDITRQTENVLPTQITE